MTRQCRSGRDTRIHLHGTACPSEAGDSRESTPRKDTHHHPPRVPDLEQGRSVQRRRARSIEATTLFCADDQLDGTNVVVLTTFDDDTDFVPSFRAGAVGYLLANTPRDDLRGRTAERRPSRAGPGSMRAALLGIMVASEESGSAPGIRRASTGRSPPGDTSSQHDLAGETSIEGLGVDEVRVHQRRDPGARASTAISASSRRSEQLPTTASGRSPAICPRCPGKPARST